jgi:hypothetical protein
MSPGTIVIDADTPEAGYTNLFASICEEDLGYIVRLRVYHTETPGRGACGEEIADSLEAASTLIETVAAHFQIPSTRIEIEIRMDNLRDGTRH